MDEPAGPVPAGPVAVVVLGLYRTPMLRSMEPAVATKTADIKQQIIERFETPEPEIEVVSAPATAEVPP